jgi:glycerol-3-phosphate dehydrogenase
VFKIEKGPLEKWYLVTEALKERNYMLNAAPYMNKKVEMFVPCSNPIALGYYLVGVNFYHFISYLYWFFSSYEYRLPRPHYVSKQEMTKLFPLIKKPVAGVSFCEGQMDDSRVVI